MIEGYMRVAAATPEIKVADTEYNASAVIADIRKAAERQAALIVFPELVLTAYTAADLFHQTALIRSAHAALDRVMEETRELPIVSVVGMPFFNEGKLYNVAAVFKGGRLLALIPKRHLPNYSEFYERRWFTPGSPRVRDILYEDTRTGESYEVPFGMDILITASDVPEFRLACELCEDVWVPCPPSTQHALAGATIIANCSASDETVGKDSYRRELIASTSARLAAVYVYANAGEGESSQDLVFGGQDLICENGTVVTESRRFQTGLYFGDVDLEKISQERARLTTYPAVEETEESEGYRRICIRIKETAGETAEAEGSLRKLEQEAGTLERFLDPHPFVPGNAEERARRCDEIFMIQAMGLKKRLQHIGTSYAVIGISGGLDSTLALLVTARAFDMLGIPRDHIISVTMPAFGTTDRTYHNAVTLTERLHATLREINIKAAVMQHFHDIGHDPEDHSVTYENSQARERTQILMDVANQLNGIVVGTGDLSELALGWATYNGDHMSMYAVNAGVPKTLVRHLVKYSADTAEDAELAACLYDVLDTPVSPELLPPTAGGTISQKTEDLVGPYELHDFFLYQILRFGFRPLKVYEMALHAFSDANAAAANDRAALSEGDQKDASLHYNVYDSETILKWLKKFYWRFFSQQFKRSCLPDGPKVGSVAVSPRGDLRMPSDAVVNCWIRELETIKA
jgi:NAD+ synthase (glutamine-hydrolysing)